MEGKRKIGYKLRFENEANASVYDCHFHQSRILDARQENDFRRRAEFFQAASSLEAVHHRHHNVEHENVGLQPQCRFNCVLSVQHEADYFELDFQKPGNHAEDRLTVIGE